MGWFYVAGGSYTDSLVYALNATTGAELWSYATGNQVYSSPAVANGVVYIGSDDGNLYALNAATGVKLWSYATGGSVGDPVVANGMVYVSATETSNENIPILFAFGLGGRGTGADLYLRVEPSPTPVKQAIYSPLPSRSGTLVRVTLFTKCS